MTHDQIRTVLEAVLREMGVADPRVHLERPRDPTHGDVATNVAMTLASTLRRPPRAIAQEIQERIPQGTGGIASVEVAGPGFLNFRLTTSAVGEVVGRILNEGSDFGRSKTGANQPVVVEFVSANPTGLLHLGHGRQAALGDAVCSLLEWTGWKVHREFYYNDAGRQIERLAESVRARYLQGLGLEAAVPEDGYHGSTVTDVAQEFLAAEGDRWREDPSGEGLSRMRRFAVERLRREQDRDLNGFRVHFDEYYLESSLYDDGRVDETVQRLRKTGLVFEQDGAVWLRTSEFGDQKDRVMIKSDGSATYFLPDVAYHVTKWERGFHHAINVQGADHHGTVARVRAGLQALGLPEGYPEYILHQMVTVEQGGQEVKFSKRAGDYLTLRDLVEEVGVDVTRYFFLMRKPEAHLVFDLDWARDQSDKNPVYKAQYAHARVCSILRRAGLGNGSGGDEGSDLQGAELGLLAQDSERELIQTLGEFPALVERAAAARAPHLVCDYLEQTAGQVNAWYHAGNPTRNPELAVLHPDPRLRRARLALTEAVRIVLASALSVLGIHAPERMERAPDEDRSHEDPSDEAAAAPGGMDYRSAGVDLDRAERAKEGIRDLVDATRDRWTLSGMGSFGGLYAVPDDAVRPVLVSSADGVGTKLKVAFLTGIHDSVGQCLVNHCVNDILVQGARPLFFLDYLATGEVEEGMVESVVAGIARACRENGCALLGGETAQMPDFYAPGEYDLAGFIVGLVDRDRLLDGSRVREGDVLVGMGSSGLHTNGYTLARRIVFERAGLGVDDPFPEMDESVGSVLLRVHRSYLPALTPEVEEGTVRALAHITGGGIPGNLPRVLPEGLGARIRTDSWEIPTVFRILAELGGVARDEMFRVFNMGVGMVAVVAPDEAEALVNRLRDRGERAWILGEITGSGSVEID
ncbi:MAG: arginine--tRNA ligase [Gemmatimonadales bacterium]|nr:MAG: arginine--tRNA ligase [Gemmatimonadales bacterium]